VHVSGGMTITTRTEWGLDPSQPPDVVFAPKAGMGWEIARNWEVNKNASFVAYEGILAQLLPPCPTIAAHWPASALMWGGWWANDGRPVYVGIFANPADNGAAESTHHGWLRLSINPDFSLTLHDWAFETEPGTPIVAGAVPEPKTWMLVAAALVGLVLLRRVR
jgi:hypothetical protein